MGVDMMIADFEEYPFDTEERKDNYLEAIENVFTIIDYVEDKGAYAGYNNYGYFQKFSGYELFSLFLQEGDTHSATVPAVITFNFGKDYKFTFELKKEKIDIIFWIRDEETDSFIHLPQEKINIKVLELFYQHLEQDAALALRYETSFLNYPIYQELITAKIKSLVEEDEEDS